MLILPFSKYHDIKLSRAVPYVMQIVAGFSMGLPRFDSRSGHVRFVMNKVALWKVFSEYFGFPSNSQLLRHHITSDV
jgi:hypothetical protein